MILDCVFVVLKDFLVEDVVDVSWEIRAKMARNKNPTLLVEDIYG